jgi:hypothetical protein
VSGKTRLFELAQQIERTNMKTRTRLFAIAMLVAAAPAGFAQPVITCQPQNQTNIAGTIATFSVCATGAPPLSYQWRSYAGTTSFTNIPWGTGATLRLTNVQPTTRRFGVVVSDAGGSVTSVLASLNVPLSLTMQPTNSTADLGATATFTVLAAGTPAPRYQWRFEGQNLLNRTNAALYLRNLKLTDAVDYTVVVTNTAGAITSQVATLTVVTPTIIRTTGTNILLIIADDYGTDASSLYNTNAGVSLRALPTSIRCTIPACCSAMPTPIPPVRRRDRVV